MLLMRVQISYATTYSDIFLLPACAASYTMKTKNCRSFAFFSCCSRSSRWVSEASRARRGASSRDHIINQRHSNTEGHCVQLCQFRLRDLYETCAPTSNMYRCSRRANAGLHTCTWPCLRATSAWCKFFYRIFCTPMLFYFAASFAQYVIAPSAHPPPKSNGSSNPLAI